MPFDAVLYEHEVIRPLRSLYGRLPGTGLARRYAIEPAMTAPDVATRLEAVRAFWRRRAEGPDRTGEICQRLIQDDAELRSVLGDRMLDPQWWRDQITGEASPAGWPAGQSSPTGTTAERPATAGPGVAHDPIGDDGDSPRRLINQLLDEMHHETPVLPRQRGCEPEDLTVAPDSDVVRITWPARAGARYVLERTIGAAGQPAAVQQTRPGEAVDHPPIGRNLRYDLRCLTEGKRSSPSTVETILLPPPHSVDTKYGPDSIELNWRVHPSALRVEARRTVDRRPETADEGTPVPTYEGGLTDRPTADDRGYHYSLRAVYRDDNDVERFSPMEVVSVGDNQAVGTEPVDDLMVEPIGTVDERQSVLLTWSKRPAADIRVYRFTEWPGWDLGQSIRVHQLEATGTAVTGEPYRQDDRDGVRALVPVGYQMYAAFVVHSSNYLAGRPAGYSLANPVGGLAIYHSGRRVLWWRWPINSRLAQVTWKGHDGTSEVVTVTRASFDRAYGFPLQWQGAGTATVQAVSHTKTGPVRSDPKEIAVPPAAVLVTYTVRGPSRLRRLRSRHFKIRVDVKADAEVCDLVLQVKARSSEVMPLRPTEGATVGIVGPLDLGPGNGTNVAVEIPREALPNRPFWIQCCLESPPGIIVSPRDLKVT